MSGGHDRRLVKLERDRRSPARIVYLWRDSPARSRRQLIARRFPKGLPPGVRVVICSWQSGAARSGGGRGAASTAGGPHEPATT